MSAHRYEDDDGIERECGDEGELCPECLEKECAYWSRYFGIRAGGSPEARAHNRNQVRAFAPVGMEMPDDD